VTRELRRRFSPGGVRPLPFGNSGGYRGKCHPYIGPSDSPAPSLANMPTRARSQIITKSLNPPKRLCSCSTMGNTDRVAQPSNTQMTSTVYKCCAGGHWIRHAVTTVETCMPLRANVPSHAGTSDHSYKHHHGTPNRSESHIRCTVQDGNWAFH
jgi:hypothetical protein